MDINRNNYEAFFLSYLDRELKPAEILAVEKFLSENADLQKEFALLQQTIFLPAEIIFEQKESLLREEEKRRIVPFYRMRIAAATAVLIIGGWLLKTVAFHSANQIKKEGIVANTQANQTKKEIAENKNLTGEHTNQMQGKTINENKNRAKTAAKNNLVKNTGTANPGTKLQNDLTKNKPDGQKDPQDLKTSPGPVENLSAVRKSSTALAIQSAVRRPGDDSQQMPLNGTQAPVLVIASAGSKDRSKPENAVLKVEDIQTDNAISVVALNDRNKAITGFFNKLTKRARADDNTRKVRVSVFQFSY